MDWADGSCSQLPLLAGKGHRHLFGPLCVYLQGRFFTPLHKLISCCWPTGLCCGWREQCSQRPWASPATLSGGSLFFTFSSSLFLYVSLAFFYSYTLSLHDALPISFFSDLVPEKTTLFFLLRSTLSSFFIQGLLFGRIITGELQCCRWSTTWRVCVAAFSVLLINGIVVSHDEGGKGNWLISIISLWCGWHIGEILSVTFQLSRGWSLPGCTWESQGIWVPVYLQFSLCGLYQWKVNVNQLWELWEGRSTMSVYCCFGWWYQTLAMLAKASSFISFE